MSEKPWDKYTQKPHQRPRSSDKDDTPQQPAPAPADEPLPVQRTAEVVTLPAPEEASLTALPLVRHWLFAPDRSRLKWRRFETTITHEGRPLKQRVTVGEPDSKVSGVLTARHQRALFVLQELWQRQGGRVALQGGHRVGLVCASSWELEEALFGAHGGRQKKLARALIHELNAIPVHFEGIPLPDGSVGELYLTGLVHGATFAGRTNRSGDQLGLPWAEITLSPWLLRAWENEDVKPIDVRVLDQLSSDLAQLLYPKLDWLLSRHDRAEFRLQGLVERLGLADKQLHQRAYRRRKFERVAAELTGAPLTAGGHLVAALEATHCGEDDKLVAHRKGSRRPRGLHLVGK